MKTYLLFTTCYFLLLLSCQHKYAYSTAQIEGVITDTIFNTSADEILIATTEALLDMGFEIEREEKRLVVTFPLYIEKENFGEYAVERVIGGYEPVKKEELYDNPSVELHCVIIPVMGGVKIRVKTIFEAFRKDILYRESSGKNNNKGYYEIEGAFIECKSTGKIEKTLFDHISQNLTLGE